MLEIYIMFIFVGNLGGDREPKAVVTAEFTSAKKCNDAAKSLWLLSGEKIKVACHPK